MMKSVFSMIAVVLFSSVLQAAQNFELSQKDYAGFPNTLRGRDFITMKTRPSSHWQSKNPEDCRANISKVVCLVGDVPPGQTPQDRVCEEASQAYALPFEQIYDKVPPTLQKMFCSLKRLYIEKQFYGTAYATTFMNPDGTIVGAAMGIRRSVLDEKLNLTTWASWKEQLSFGGVADSYTITPALPQIITSSEGDASDFLYMLIAHEFGHMFDFANDLNKSKNCQPNLFDLYSDECELVEGTWGALSWARTDEPLAGNDFKNRKDGLCFYGCDGKTMSPADVTQVYGSLAQTNFISTYASKQPWDDFADSLAYFLMEQNLKTNYVIDTKQGAHYDMMWKLKSPQFATKYNYIQKFLERTDIIYP